MGARSKARRRAVEVLYEADIRDVDVSEIAEARVRDKPLSEGPYALSVVAGVAADMAALDRDVARCAEGWDIARMPAVDRALLRVGAWELRQGEVPIAVVIDEAVSIAGELSTDESPRFVNGVLGRLAREPS